MISQCSPPTWSCATIPWYQEIDENFRAAELGRSREWVHANASIVGKKRKKLRMTRPCSGIRPHTTKNIHYSAHSFLRAWFAIASYFVVIKHPPICRHRTISDIHPRRNVIAWRRKTVGKRRIRANKGWISLTALIHFVFRVLLVTSLPSR